MTPSKEGTQKTQTAQVKKSTSKAEVAPKVRVHERGLTGASEVQRDKSRAKFFASKQAGHPRMRKDAGDAFVREADGASNDDYATEMALGFLVAAETGVEVLEELSDERMVEENGGPFQITAAGSEFAEGFDESNPEGSTREALPTPMRKSE